MNSDLKNNQKKPGQEVPTNELNSWRRGFTPQAEIWNGRMAMIGVFLVLGFVITLNLIYG